YSAANGLGYQGGNPLAPANGYLRLIQDGKNTLLQYDEDGAAGKNYTWHTAITLQNVLATAVNGNNFKGLSIEGTAGADTLTGGFGVDILNGAGGNDILNGGQDADSMTGGLGNDTYYVDNLGDVVIEKLNEGTDTVLSTASDYTLSANVENGRITTGNAANLTGNALNNVIYAGTGNNKLSGGAGTDTLSYLYGVTGSNGVKVSLASTVAQATVGSGTDTLTGFENLTGSRNNDSLTGSSGNNVLDGGLGNDTLVGGAGDDTYVINSSSDVIIENAGGGTDTVNVQFSGYTLGANIEHGRISTTAAANITGNSLSNTLYAGAGNNVIMGGTGTEIDTASYADAASAVRVSLAITTGQATLGSGTDTLINIENLTGSNFNDTLTGSAGNNVLNGGAGNDSMAGGAGNDVYYVHQNADVVIEAANAGTDTVYSYATSYTLSANVENGRILATTASNLYGNALNNVIHAGSGNNVLAGGAGTDTLSYLYGVTGSNGVKVSLASTTAQATGGSGSDTLSGFENLTGSGNNDSLTGSSGNNVLDGGLGNDTLTGGAGDDTYVINNSSDVIIEKAGEGTDTVNVQFSGYTLGANIENGRISTTAAADITGNNLSNTLYAGAGNNVIIGGTGAEIDTVSYASASSAVKVSLAITTSQATLGSGTDTLVNIENLVGSNFNDLLTGSAGNNVLNGGAGNDSLSGGNGNDTLIGGAGKDTLVGGAGNDVFDFNAASETGITSATWDVISGFVRGQDKIDLSTIDANTTTLTNDAFDSLIVGAAFSGRFTSVGDLYFDNKAQVLYGNIDADADAEFAIQLIGVSTLSTADLVL
ncbi:beta strand repeat-containing protein, partial [Pseudomonas sp. 3A(2025)]